MRILIVSELFYPRLRGGEVVLWRIAKALASRGHDIHVVTAQLPDTSASERVEGIQIHRPFALGSHGKSTTWRMLIRKLRFLVKLDRYLDRIIKGWRPDVIYNNAYTVTLPCGRAGRKHGIPVVTNIGNFQGAGHLNASRRLGIGQVQRLKEYVTLRFGGHVAVRVASRGVANQVERLTQAEVYAIPSPIDDELIRMKLKWVDRWDVRTSLGVQEDERFLLYVGELAPIKNVDGLLRVLGEVDTPFQLFIGGKGSEEPRLKQLAQDLGLERQVHFLGELQPPRVLELMGSCDAFLLPSASETGPVVVLEALAMGAQVISTHVGFVDEIHSENLRVVESVSDMAHALNELGDPVEDWRVLEAYSERRIVDQFEQMLSRVIDQARA